MMPDFILNTTGKSPVFSIAPNVNSVTIAISGAATVYLDGSSDGHTFARLVSYAATGTYTPPANSAYTFLRANIVSLTPGSSVSVTKNDIFGGNDSLLAEHIKEHLQLGVNAGSGGGLLPTLTPSQNFGVYTAGDVDNTAAINSALVTAATLMVPVVNLGANSYYVAGTIVPQNGVILRGQGWALQNVSNSRIVSSGTLLVGAGTNIGIGFNSTDAGSQPSVATIFANKLDGSGCQDMAFTNFSYAIKIGALMNVGSFNGQWGNLYAYACTNWGFWFENCCLEDYGRMEYQNSIGSGTGGLTMGGVFHGASLSNWNAGNSKYKSIYTQNSGAGFVKNTRNIVFMAGRPGMIGAAKFNDLNVDMVQSNSPGPAAAGTKITVAATMTNASPNIVLTAGQGVNFPLDMPVTVDVSQNGFIAYQTYFVVSQVSDTIQLANYQGGTAINATGAVAVNVVTYGFPGLEIVGYGTSGSGNQIQPSSFRGIDMEGTATCSILIQNAYTNLDIDELFGSAQTTNYISHLCGRNPTGTYRAANTGVVIDYDNKGNAFFCLGMDLPTDTETKSVIQSGVIGIFRDRALGKFSLNLCSDPIGYTSKTFQSQKINNSGYDYVYPFVAIGEKISHNGSASITLGAGQAGAICYTGGVNTTWTLPTLAAGEGGALNSSGGVQFSVSNATTTVGVVLTLAAGGTDTFNYRGSAKTSWSIAQGQSISIVAQYDGTGPYWQVLGINGAA